MLILLFSFIFSRDSRIRQLELELAAAPKQEKVERSVIQLPCTIYKICHKIYRNDPVPHACIYRTYNSYLPVIGVHELHRRMHPNYFQITTVNCEYFDVKIFSDSMTCAKIKRTKYMRNINDNAVQGRLSENYLTRTITA